MCTSVSKGSNLFVNIVIDFDDYKTIKIMNKPFPQGNYIYIECEEKLRKVNICQK